mgnify:CR=1 FL=1
MTTADVTVIVTCYNHQAYVEQCLESLAAQTTAPAQILIVDDESSDDSVAVIRNWLSATGHAWDLLAHERNIGLCATLNEALARTTGRFVCNVSSDDWIFPDRIATQAAVMSAAPEDTAFVVGDLREVDVAGRLLADHDIGRRLRGLEGFENRGAFTRRMLEANVVPAPSVMMRTSAVRAVGGWDEHLLFEDYDMWLRLAEIGGVQHSPGLATCWRVLQSSLSHDARRAAQFAEAESAMVSKHLGRDPEWDDIIRTRVADLAASVKPAVAGDVSAARRRFRWSPLRGRTTR